LPQQNQLYFLEKQKGEIKRVFPREFAEYISKAICVFHAANSLNLSYFITFSSKCFVGNLTSNPSFFLYFLTLSLDSYDGTVIPHLTAPSLVVIRSDSRKACAAYNGVSLNNICTKSVVIGVLLYVHPISFAKMRRIPKP